MANSVRKCGACKQYFRPERDFPGPVAWCSVDCGTELARKRLPKQREKQRKREKAITRAQKEAIKTKPQLTKECQQAFNAFVRLRDEGLPCISCGRLPQQKYGGTMDCGHYRSTGSCPELRFEELNAASQCVRCNRDLSGSAVDYRLGLIKRIGLEKVEWLECHHEPKHYTHDELREIRDHYRAKVNQMRREKRGAA